MIMTHFLFCKTFGEYVLNKATLLFFFSGKEREVFEEQLPQIFGNSVNLKISSFHKHIQLHTWYTNANH